MRALCAQPSGQHAIHLHDPRLSRIPIQYWRSLRCKPFVQLEEKLASIEVPVTSNAYGWNVQGICRAHARHRIEQIVLWPSEAAYSAATAGRCRVSWNMSARNAAALSGLRSRA